MEAVDIITPTGGDIMDIKTPSVGCGRSGQPMRLSYTEEVGRFMANLHQPIPENASY